jgi:methanogenic corrinoid protein MtbC1
MMKAFDYKATLEDAAKTLQEAEILVFTAIVNVGFAGEYSDISGLYEEGEILNFEPAMFEDTNDQNLTILTETLKKIVKAKERIIKLNGLKTDIGE